MAQLNLRSIPDEIYQRVRLAAANGGTRIPKGGLERFVVRALRRAVEDPQPGAGLPRLKLCANCFQVNRERANAPKPTTVPASAYEVAAREVVSEKKTPVELFSHLLSEEESSAAESAAAGGMLAEQEGTEIPAYMLDGSCKLPKAEGGTIKFNYELAGGNGAQGDLATRLGTRSETPASGDSSLEDELECAGAVRVSGQGLWVGSDQVTRTLRASVLQSERLSILSAAKDPWHRQMVGYKTRSAPETEERLCARRGNHMAVNLIDVRELGPGGECYIPAAVIEAALGFIHERLEAGDQVLVHCNAGHSRAPSIAFLYMLREGMLPSDAAGPAFRDLYPSWEPSAGFRKYLEQHSVSNGWAM